MTQHPTRLIRDWEIEQRSRWEARDKVLLECFLERHPLLVTREDLMIDLIYAEFRLRHELGETVDPTEYEQRFPAYASQFKSLFEAHLANGSVSAQTALRAVKQIINTVDDLPPVSDESGPVPLRDCISLATVPLPGATNPAVLRFRVLRPHAQGGLGEVFVAFDEELRREVALKHIRTQYADHPERRERFVAEAEITGGLEHPGIVPVYGLGSYEDGRPFYAMRFIRGESLKSAIDRFHEADGPGRDATQRALELRKLLSRLIDVCDAIEYAHSRGVLHRDLKPANIMLGKFGETLVVDWGLAKTMGGSSAPSLAIERPLEVLSRSRSAETHMGSAVGTAQYMSPEQAAGRLDLINRASDVYCLGSTLYHLLTGRPPVDDKEFGVILQRVETGNIPRPRTIKPSVPPPLEAICLKAISLEPANRYPSARSLADDIEHWMADEPVSAYPESSFARAGRWLRKHRSWARAATAALVTVSLVAVAATLLVDDARRKESIARQEAVEGFTHARETIDTWLTGAGEVLKYYPSMQEIRRVLLRQAAADYDQLAQGHSDTSLNVERGRAQIRLGDVHRLLGDVAASEQAYRDAQEIFRGLIANDPAFIDAQIELASAGTKRALLLVDNALLSADSGQMQKADKQYETTIDQLKQTISIRPNDRRAHEALATALVNRATLQRELGDPSTAMNTLRQSLDEFAVAHAGSPREPRGRFAVAAARSLWGRCLVDTGEYQLSVAKFGEALAELESLATNTASEPEYLESQAATFVAMASAFRNMGKYTEELNCYQRAVAAYEIVNRALPHAPPIIEGIALTRTDMGQLLLHLGEASRAEAELNLALPVFVELRTEYPSIPRYLQEEAASQDALGRVYDDLGRNDMSKLAHQRGVEAFGILKKAVPDVGEYQLRHAICVSHLGAVLHKLGAHEEAKRELRAAVTSLDELSATSLEAKDAACFARVHLGELLFENGDRDEAAKYFAHARADWERLIAQSPSAEVQDHLAWFLVSCSDPKLRDGAQATKVAQQALQQAPDNAYYYGTLAAAQYRTGEFDRSIATLARTFEIRKQYQGREWFILAMALWKTGADANARQALESGQQWREAQLPGNAELLRLENEAQKLIEAGSQS